MVWAACAPVPLPLTCILSSTCVHAPCKGPAPPATALRTVVKNMSSMCSMSDIAFLTWFSRRPAP